MTTRNSERNFERMICSDHPSITGPMEFCFTCGKTCRLKCKLNFHQGHAIYPAGDSKNEMLTKIRNMKENLHKWGGGKDF